MSPVHQAILPAIANLFAVLAIGNLMKIYRNKSCKIEVFASISKLAFDVVDIKKITKK